MKQGVASYLWRGFISRSNHLDTLPRPGCTVLLPRENSSKRHHPGESDCDVILRVKSNVPSTLKVVHDPVNFEGKKFMTRSF